MQYILLKKEIFEFYIIFDIGFWHGLLSKTYQSCAYGVQNDADNFNSSYFMPKCKSIHTSCEVLFKYK